MIRKSKLQQEIEELRIELDLLRETVEKDYDIVRKRVNDTIGLVELCFLKQHLPNKAFHHTKRIIKQETE